MKKVIVLIIVVLCVGTLPAQEKSSQSKSRFNADYQTYKKLSLGTDLTYDIWQSMPDAVGRRGFNRSASFFGTYNFKLSNSNFYVCPGLGFNFRNIYGKALLQRDTVGDITYVPIPKGTSYKKAKTTLSYIELPVDLRYSYKRFQAGIGVKVSCNIGVASKYKGDQFFEDGMAGNSAGGSHIKEKWLQIPVAERFQFGGQVRIGYSWIHAYGYYSFTKVFKSSTEIEMYPISVGISVMPFR
ncbi:MAG: PorT family protein [Bacteroidales bacterium]|jgi:hypothetical protein|nr:PorT family protein [Bacteroidales bacterium]